MAAAGGEEVSLFIPFLLYFKVRMVRILRCFVAAIKQRAQRIAGPPFGLIVANLIQLSH